MLEKTASTSSTVASFRRRMNDWQNQLSLANKELQQLDKQIASANVKLDIATKELANQDLVHFDFMKSLTA
jgi:septal ring factor EnvC (AmiA/AmiB activator)